MKSHYLFLALATTGVLFGVSGLTRSLVGHDQASKPDREADARRIEHGRHIVRIAGCNDCHTPGFMEDPKVPESQWLTGTSVGWRGPWGTTYPSNLRRHLAAWDDPQAWMRMVRSREGLPPMPWPNLHAMTDEELLSVYAYIRSLPVTGEIMPAPVPPDQTPSTPWLNLAPVGPTESRASGTGEVAD